MLGDSRSGVLAAIATAALVGVAGCGRAPQGAVEVTPEAGVGAAGVVVGPAGYPSAAAATRLARARGFDDGIRFDVPAATSTAKITATQAYGTCAQDGVCYSGAAPLIELSTVTVPGVAGPTSAPGPIQNRLAYVVSWSAEPCSPAGGPPQQAKSPTTCSLYNIVDAESGNVLYGFQRSNPV